MSRIVVVGASGRTGGLIVRQLVAKGHEVVGTIRNPKHMAALVKAGANAMLVDLDKSGFDEIVFALKGADAVIFAAGSSTGESSALDRKGVLRTLRAAEKAGVPRYLAISSIGASTGMKLAGAWATDEMRDYYKQKRAANRLIRESALNWTIVEPGELTEGKGTGKVTLSTEAIKEAKVSRADVAAVLVAALDLPATIGKTFQLVSGTAPIETALQAAAGAPAAAAKPAAAKAPARKAAAKAPAEKAAAKTPAKKATAAKAPAKKAPAKKAAAKR